MIIEIKAGASAHMWMLVILELLGTVSSPTTGSNTSSYWWVFHSI
jgi:hypothetical protein